MAKPSVILCVKSALGLVSPYVAIGWMDGWRIAHNVHQVQKPSQLSTRIHLFLFILVDCVISLFSSLSTIRSPLARYLDRARCSRRRRRFVRMGIMTMTMVMSCAASCNAQSLIHGHECHKSDHDSKSEYQVPVRLDEYEAHVLGGIFAKEYFGQEVEKRVAQQAAYRKGDHDGQRRGINVRGTESEQKVGRARYIESREQGVDGRGTRKEDGEDLGRHGRRVGRGCELRGVELLYDRACLELPLVHSIIWYVCLRAYLEFLAYLL